MRLRLALALSSRGAGACQLPQRRSASALRLSPGLGVEDGCQSRGKRGKREGG